MDNNNDNSTSSLSDKQLDTMLNKIIDDVFKDDPNWTADKETAKSNFPEEAN